ncbi:non-ribosomal peptide synthetase, partial [Mesorhizobium mediterraneum]|uniref:non-ribosomal peptide synthetase n=1 Tax=Mesorhizobium mediterraneum TaxID=43617 RepID=UPI00177F3467
HRGGRVAVRVEPDLRTRLERLSRERGVTLFTTLLAAFQVLLHRYSGQTDIAIGTPIAGRSSAEIEGLIGFFVNTLVIRTDLAGDPPFAELLGRVRETTLGAYSHQDIPFEQVVAELKPERSLSHSPLFQIMFVYQNAPADELALAGLEAQALQWDAGFAKFDLTLGLGSAGDGALEGTFEYASDLFEAATVERIAGHWLKLLEAVLADPGERIGRLAMLDAEERHRLVEAWNRTELVIDQPRDCAVLCERQVERTPDRVAVLADGSAVSYRCLDRLANGIARRLQALGIGPERCVGICLERSERMVAAVLGVWKAGAAWVPMDPAYPEQRLAWIAEDARLDVILCEPSTVGRLSAGDATLIFVEEIEPQQEAPHRDTHAANLAYIIYTSGSTGRPKGVAICHANLAALLAWAETVFSVEDIAAVVAGTSICFDLSLFELFVPLTRGGTVVLVENILQLPQVAPGRHATLINTVPSAVPELLRQDGLAASIRVVNLAGEPLKRDLVDRLHRATAVRKVFDLYGPSEDTTYSTCALRQPGGPEVIGRPVGNTRL